nr:zinc ribbon domain-containing protein [Mycolicibacterium mengxianglii]
MVLYAFRCEQGCGVIQQNHAMDLRPDVVDCPECLGVARRTLGSPYVGRADGTAMALQDATRATADTPAVVRSPSPPGRRQPVTRNPLHSKLPRP